MVRMTTGGGSSSRRTATRGGQAVQPGHADVHQHDVGPAPANRLHRVGAVVGLADDGDVVGRLEDHPQPGADQRLVVDDERRGSRGATGRGGRRRRRRRAAAAGHGRATGSQATTRQPPSAVGPDSSVPPTRATRSRSPSRPAPEPGSSAALPTGRRFDDLDRDAAQPRRR